MIFYRYGFYRKFITAILVAAVVASVQPISTSEVKTFHLGGGCGSLAPGSRFGGGESAEPLERYFLEEKGWVFANKKAAIEAQLQEKGAAPELISEMVARWALQFVEAEVGPRYMRAFLAKVDPEGKIPMKRGLSTPETEIARLWDELGLGNEAKEAQRRQLVERVARFYDGIGKGADSERRALVKGLASLISVRSGYPIKKIDLYLTDVCGINCRHCFRLGLASEVRRKRLDRSKLDEILEFAKRHNVPCIGISGGEPMLMRDEIVYIIEHAPACVKWIGFITNGYWALSPEITQSRMEPILAAVKNRKRHDPAFTFPLRTSCDSFHQEIVRRKDERLKERVPIANIANIIKFAAEANIPLEVSCIIEPRQEALLGRLKEALTEAGLRYKIIFPKTALSSGILLLRGYPYAQITIQLTKGLQLLGGAELLEDFERHSYIDEIHLPSIFSFGKLPSPPPIVLEGLSSIAIHGDGNVVHPTFVDAWYIWNLGNIGEAPLEEIYRSLSVDPLAKAIWKNHTLLRDIALEVMPPILKERLEKAPAIFEFIQILFEDPQMRLYLTKRLIQEDKGIGNDVKERLGLNVSVDILKAEYADGESLPGGYLSVDSGDTTLNPAVDRLEMANDIRGSL